MKGDSLPPYLSPSQKGPLMRSTRRTTGHLAKNSVVDTWTDACSLRCIFLPFWPIHLPASAIHTMKARGNDKDDDETTATTAMTRCGTRTSTMNNERRDDENGDEDDEDNKEEEDEDDRHQTQ